MEDANMEGAQDVADNAWQSIAGEVSQPGRVTGQARKQKGGKELLCGLLEPRPLWDCGK